MFFQVVIVMVKDKKRCIIKDTMLIKTSFMHFRNYITWTRVKLPEVFEEFDMVYIFWLLFFFPLLLSVGKRSILIKIWGGCSSQPPWFLRACVFSSYSNIIAFQEFPRIPFFIWAPFSVYLVRRSNL